MFDRKTPRALTCVASLALLTTAACRDQAPADTKTPDERSQAPATASEAPEPDPALEAREVTDAGITAAVGRELLLDHIAPEGAISIETTDGIVELTGTVDHLLAKQRAAQIAELVKGVRTVSNRVEVKAVDIDDSELKTHVVEALLFDPAAESYELDVSVKDGVVTLDGQVDSWAEKQLAARVAASVRGVEAVENRVDVEYDAERPDRELLAEIEKRLRWDVLVDHEGIEVAVDDGEVQLSGQVGSAAERRRAEFDAWTSGITGVDSSELEVFWIGEDPNLRKRNFTPRSAEAVREAIEDAALHDPRVFSFDIEPEVVGTRVTLRGTVDNLEAKQAAGQLARNTVGVGHVVNKIEVVPHAEFDDAQAAADLRARLLTNVYTDASDIDVDVDAGVVTLTGVVDSFLEKAEAGELAASTKGVLLVDNKLQVDKPEIGHYADPYLDVYVHPWPAYAPMSTRMDDEALEQEIEEELFWSPFVDEHQVHVDVVAGEATLTGVVDTWAEREAATENAFEGGALFVDNLLHVEK